MTERVYAHYFHHGTLQVPLSQRIEWSIKLYLIPKADAKICRGTTLELFI